MYLEIRRNLKFIQEDKSTFSQIFLVRDVEEELLSIAIEREFDNNASGTALPPGAYELVAHNGEKYQNTYALVNHDLDVGHLPGEAKRYACVFHAVTWGRQLEGCVGPVKALRVMDGAIGGIYSSRALEKVLKTIRDNDITQVVIREM